jgi:dihydroorotase
MCFDAKPGYAVITETLWHNAASPIMRPNSVDKITLTRPDDWHLHLRDGDAMQAVVAHTAERFARAIVMPNLRPPVTTTEQALAYRERILAALPSGSPFQPLMTLYLTDNTPPDEIARAKESGAIQAVKLYPAGATTNSDSGLTDIHKAEATLRAMAECGMPLLVHGEVTDNAVDIFDRERVFLETVLAPLLERIPDLKLIAEHITTAEMARFVLGAGDKVAATITPQHLLLNRNALLAGGIRPHNYCLPVLKRESHREVLMEMAISGNPKFFLGTDSAPHAKHAKETACGCAGIYSAHAAIELYAEAFDAAGALDKLEGFASFHGADFYGLPRNSDTITLKREEWLVPESYEFGGEKLVPLRAGEKVAWKLV